MPSTLEQQLTNYFTRLSEHEKKSFVALLKNFLKARKAGAEPPTLEEYNKELELADTEIESGDFILHEDVVKYFSKK